MRNKCKYRIGPGFYLFNYQNADEKLFVCKFKKNVKFKLYHIENSKTRGRAVRNKNAQNKRKLQLQIFLNCYTHVFDIIMARKSSLFTF